MKKTIAFAAAALLLAACNNGTGENEPQEPVMKFMMNHPGASRATDTGFESGDKIGLFVVEYDGETAAPLQISGNWANNVATTFADGVWTPEKKIFWSDQKVDVYAYYPYMALTSVDEQEFSVSLDQNTPGTESALSGYEASDLLWAKATEAEQADETVALQFRHCLSKFVVRLEKGPDYEGELPDDATLYLHNTVPTATFDVATGVATKYMFGNPATIKMRKVDNATYEAIVVPQRIETHRPLVEMVSGGISYLLESSFQFKTGMLHTLTLTINSSPEQIEIEIGGSVGGGWN